MNNKLGGMLGMFAMMAMAGEGMMHSRRFDEEEPKKVNIKWPDFDPRMPLLTEEGKNIRTDTISIDWQGETLIFETSLSFTTQKAYNKKMTLLKNRIINYLEIPK